ncbi:hypothetical protein UPYG_G00059090 [Umbra pygmaea]|uniref:Immunoglobulin domain-containing protein n=1 Tax=Umbra pygmaea TaxID=75934 RepID=A0ABD0XC00_UMBPY
MMILLIFTLISFITANVKSLTVTGYYGGTVIIYCHYSVKDKSNNKYFCKGPEYIMHCEDKITTDNTNSWQHSGRFSLYESTEGNYFRVFIRQLTRQDEGTYWCGVDKPAVLGSYTKVELEVKEDECCNKSVTETAYLGEEAKIICNYPKKYRTSVKYFCKETHENDCKYMISVPIYIKHGRYTLSSKRTERSYTVTISDLTEDDTGTYWCGVEQEENYTALTTQVQLLVKPTKAKRQTGLPTIPSVSSSSMSLSSSSLNGQGTTKFIMVSMWLCYFW